ncbi:hypothetical protein ONZ45_g9080 [Pleurotus djamor]|nr:hypothetical protein ONZ45_g9080 [Pleurotus djamor]
MQRFASPEYDFSSATDGIPNFDPSARSIDVDIPSRAPSPMLMEGLNEVELNPVPLDWNTFDGSLDSDQPTPRRLVVHGWSPSDNTSEFVEIPLAEIRPNRMTPLELPDDHSMGFQPLYLGPELPLPDLTLDYGMDDIVPFGDYPVGPMQPFNQQGFVPPVNPADPPFFLDPNQLTYTWTTTLGPAPVPALFPAQPGPQGLALPLPPVQVAPEAEDENEDEDEEEEEAPPPPRRSARIAAQRAEAPVQYEEEATVEEVRDEEDDESMESNNNEDQTSQATTTEAETASSSSQELQDPALQAMIDHVRRKCKCRAVLRGKRAWERHHCKFKPKPKFPCPNCDLVLCRIDALVRHQRDHCKGQRED